MFIRQYSCIENGKRRAYWGLVESYRTARGPRQRVVAWLGKLDEAGRLGVQQAAESKTEHPADSTGDRQKSPFGDEPDRPQPPWIEVNAAGRSLGDCRR